jgi:hypothetical protein
MPDSGKEFEDNFFTNGVFTTSYLPAWGATPSVKQAEDKFTTSSTTTSGTISATIPPPSPTKSAINSISTVINDHLDEKKNFWNNMAQGAKGGVIFVIVIGVMLIIAFSIWYCCGCCGLRARRRKRIEATENANRSVPLHTVHNQATDVNRGVPLGEVPPPRYEESVPLQHQRIEGGITHVREEEEGIISDGKTPLSEIPFEDVVLDYSPSEGSARGFGDRHHGLGGDTTGHTNS